MLVETEKSSDVCRTASLSEMGHEQRASTDQLCPETAKDVHTVCGIWTNFCAVI